jgi:hypothetical protein
LSIALSPALKLADTEPGRLEAIFTELALAI